MKVSIIIPVYNGETTIAKALRSLELQSADFDELIIINDASKDSSRSIIESWIKSSKSKNVSLVDHKKPKGLASTYNEGIRKSKGDLIVTMHQDVILEKKSLEKLIKPFQKDNLEIVASYHVVLHPISVWKKYNFWQKAFFARLVKKKYYGLDGKFDCFRKSSVKKIGYFDEKHFRTAGEDGEIISRLEKIGKLVKTEARIIHLHRASNNFSALDIINKQGQYSEAQGVMLRLGVIKTPKQFASAFFRELILLSIFIPIVQFFGFLLILVYAFIYTRLMYKSEWRDPRIFLLPFLNIVLLFVSFYNSVAGFIKGKQTN